MKNDAIVVLTGAGISAESGLKTFRDNDGLWENYRVEDVCTPEAYRANPERVHRFYNARRAQLLNQAKPNAAHLALAQFAQQYTGQFTLITQNVDNLHEQAGSQNVLHMHGELLKVRCCRTLAIYEWSQAITPETRCPCCQQAGTLRPHIVWFGEIPFCMGDISQALSECDLFITIGTSGHVYPAAGFAEEARARGISTIEFNLEATSNVFDQHFLGSASHTVPLFFEQRLIAAA